jgi:hypothetical protein
MRGVVEKNLMRVHVVELKDDKIRGILRRDLQTEDSLSSRMSAKARASGKNSDFFHTQKGMKSTP